MAESPSSGALSLAAVSEPIALHEEEVLSKAYDARLMRRLLTYVRPFRGIAASAVALIIASSLLQLVGPLATAVALDLFIRPRGEAGAGSTVSQWVGKQLAAYS